MFHTEQEQTNFIRHLEYLLTLGDVQRCRRADWKALKRLLTTAGHWKRRYRLSEAQKQERQRLCTMYNNARRTKLKDLYKIKEAHDKALEYNSYT